MTFWQFADAHYESLFVLALLLVLNLPALLVVRRGGK